MATKRDRRRMVAILAVLILGLVAQGWAQRLQTGYRDPREFFGPRFQGGQDAPRPERSRREDAVRRWNEILLGANALDHTPVAPGENRVFGEQAGPHRTSRAFAIVHIAIFDAVNAIAGGHKSYTGLPPASRDISMHAAIAQAAHDTLVALYPSQKPSFDELLAKDLLAVAQFSWSRSISIDTGISRDNDQGLARLCRLEPELGADTAATVAGRITRMLASPSCEGRKHHGGPDTAIGFRASGSLAD